MKLKILVPAARMEAETKLGYLPSKHFLFPLCYVTFFQALKTWVPVVSTFKSFMILCQIFSVSLSLGCKTGIITVTSVILRFLHKYYIFSCHPCLICGTELLNPWNFLSVEGIHVSFGMLIKCLLESP